MTRLRLPIIIVALAATTGGAQAQNFFERLFGLAPVRSAPPPTASQGVPNPFDPLAPPTEERRHVPAPIQARPTSMRVPTEESVIGRELKLNGSLGSMRIERGAGSDLRAVLTLAGRRSAQSAETCAVSLGGTQGVPLVSQGRPDGLQRYALREGGCPLQIDILDEAVLVKGPAEACTFTSVSCQADPSGMWGPDGNSLLAKAQSYESARGAADKGVRENYKAMTQRARPEQVRPIVSEQASFSSEREMLCRSYAKEGSHSFCNSRFSEARLISLAQRLGVTYASVQVTPAGGDPRRLGRRADPYGLAPPEDLVQGRSFELD